MRAGDGRGRLDCLGIGLAERAEEIPARGARCHLAFRPQVVHRRGEERLQLRIADFQLEEQIRG